MKPIDNSLQKPSAQCEFMIGQGISSAERLRVTACRYWWGVKIQSCRRDNRSSSIGVHIISIHDALYHTAAPALRRSTAPSSDAGHIFAAFRSRSSAIPANASRSILTALTSE